MCRTEGNCWFFRLGENVYAVHVHVLKQLQASSVHNVGIIQLPYMASCDGKHVRHGPAHFSICNW